MTEQWDIKPREPVHRRFAARVPNQFYQPSGRQAPRMGRGKPLRWSIQRRLVRPGRLKVG